MAQKYALLIGVDEYEDSSIPDLNNPLHNIVALSEILVNPRVGEFSRENVDVLSNPTYKSAKRAISELFSKAKRDDLAVFYFSGHGFLQEQQLYLALQDSVKEYLDLEAVSAYFIASQMSRSRAKKQVIILDCCHAGAFEPPPGLKPSVNAIVLTASDKTEYAWENHDGHYSLFTQNLIEGLKEGKIDCDSSGQVTIEEIYRYTRRKLSHSKQNPLRLYPFGRQEEEIVIAKSPSFLMLHDANFTVNKLTIPHMIPEYLFLKDNALTKEDIYCVYEDIPTLLLDDLISVKREYIRQKEEEARINGFTFDNNLSYSLYGFSTERKQGSFGQRENRYLVHLRPTEYFNFVFPNLALDEIINLEGSFTTPREVLGLGEGKIRIENLRDYACDFKIGTGTVFITSDRKITVSLRARSQFIVGGAKYHLSTAEGMLRPADEIDGQISPFFTSIRSLNDELGLQAEEDFISDDIQCIGLFLDTFRAQPFFMFYVKSSQITFNELKDKWRFFAKDRHENRDIIGLDWNLSTAKVLVKGQLNYTGSEVTVASNHAQTGFMVASLHEFGKTFLQ